MLRPCAFASRGDPGRGPRLPPERGCQSCARLPHLRPVLRAPARAPQDADPPHALAARPRTFLELAHARAAVGRVRLHLHNENLALAAPDEIGAEDVVRLPALAPAKARRALERLDDVALAFEPVARALDGALALRARVDSLLRLRRGLHQFFSASERITSAVASCFCSHSSRFRCSSSNSLRRPSKSRTSASTRALTRSAVRRRFSTPTRRL